MQKPEINLSFFDAISQYTYQFLRQRDAMNLAYTCKGLYYRARLFDVKITNNHKLNEMLLFMAKRVTVAPRCDNHTFDVSFMNDLRLLDIANLRSNNNFILPKKMHTLWIAGTNIKDFSDFDIKSMWIDLEEDSDYVLPTALEKLKIETCVSCKQLNNTIKNLNLRKLKIDANCCDASHDIPIDFRHMTNLRHLAVSYCRVYDLHGLNLESLEMEEVTCAGTVPSTTRTAVSLKNMKTLKTLYIAGSEGYEEIPMTDDDLEGLELNNLTLNSTCRLNLSKVKSVKNLTVINSDISDEYLHNLSIERMVLANACNIKDVSKMPTLKKLYVYGKHGLDQECVKKLGLDVTFGEY